MPREAPVTSATFPSKSILANLLEIVKRFLQGLHIFHVQAGDSLVNTAVEAAESLARAGLNKGIGTEFLHGLHAVNPLHGVVCLLHQVLLDFSSLGLQLASVVGNHRECCIMDNPLFI